MYFTNRQTDESFGFNQSEPVIYAQIVTTIPVCSIHEWDWVCFTSEFTVPTCKTEFYPHVLGDSYDWV